MNNFAVAIFGPTGVGKTAISIELAKYFGEIISVDSRQVYQYMNIGTAKPSYSQLEIVKHYLIDIITPDIRYTAAEFKNRSEKIIKEILDKKKIPFLVGGTGLYFTSIFNGMIDIPSISEKTRNSIEEKFENDGQEIMYNLLKEKDPEYAYKIHINDKQRTLRALEIYYETGKKFSCFLQTGNYKKEYQYIKICINMDRESLYKRINERVDLMISNGLVDEVKSLLKMGYNENSPGMKSIGYAEIIQFLLNNISLDEAIYKIKLNSRHYAKRQLTWFRRFEDTKWFENCNVDILKKYIDERLESIN